MNGWKSPQEHRIVTDGRKKVDRAPERHLNGRASIQAGRDQTDLLQNLADCSQYMAGRVDHFAAHLQRVRKQGQTAMEGEAAEAREGTDDANQQAPGPAANSTAGAATVSEPAPGPPGS